jgi:hypothetical protein
VKAVGRAAGIEGADQRVPVRAVGMDVQMPHRISLRMPLRLQRAEHDPAVAQHHRVQRAGDVQVADLLQVLRVSSSPMLVAVVHHEQLQAIAG